MKNKSILLKSIICGSVSLMFLLLLIFVVYIVDFFEGAYIIGLLSGVIIALVTCCDTLKKTVAARFMGIFSAIVSQFIFTISGAPYAIIMFIYRNNELVQEIGHLTVNEAIGYNFGSMIYLHGLLISLIVTTIIVSIANLIEKRKKQT